MQAKQTNTHTQSNTRTLDVAVEREKQSIRQGRVCLGRHVGCECEVRIASVVKQCRGDKQNSLR